MKTQLDEKQDLISKVENLSSINEIRQLKVFIAGMEAGKAAKESKSEGIATQIPEKQDKTA